MKYFKILKVKNKNHKLIEKYISMTTVDIFAETLNPCFFCFYKTETESWIKKADEIYIAKQISEIPKFVDLLKINKYTVSIESRQITISFEKSVIRIHDIMMCIGSTLREYEERYPDIHSMVLDRNQYYFPIRGYEVVLEDLRDYWVRNFKKYLTREEDMKYFYIN